MNRYSILVVDDEPDNFEVIEALLTSMNYTLHYASHGQEAIDSLDRCEPDLILLDVMMPGIDGIEVCKQIKAMPQWQAVPIIMVTALTSTADLARCLTEGADDFLSKPVNVVELRARVQSMLRIKKQHDRIKSLSNLQRNSINSLKSSLSELNSDLFVSFSNESNASVNNILSRINLLQQNIDKMTTAEIQEMLKSIDQSAVELNTVNQKSSLSRQLSPSLEEFKNQETSTSKISIEQIATRHIGQSQLSTKLFFHIEDAELAVAPKHLQYIIGELLDYILNFSKSKDSINIYGHIKNEEFHCYIDNQAVGTKSISSIKIPEVNQFKLASNSEQEFSTGLKIAKKIVEIHDGLFLLANTDQVETAVYITLPLRRSISLPKPVVSMPVNQIGSISDELENLYLG
jgi:two-component system, sensor histidine kinase and response regulator